jgi:hypothetical protein
MSSQEELKKNNSRSNKSEQETGEQNTQDQATTKNLDDFIKDEEENFDEKDFESGPSAEKGISGINEKEATALLTNMIAGNIPQEHRQEFLQTYPVRVETLLKFVGFEELTEGANVKELPSWVRIIIMVVGVGGLTFATVRKYQPAESYDEQEEENQKEEGWKG